MGGELPVCVGPAGDISGCSADGLVWPMSVWPLRRAQRRQADVRSWGSPTAAVDPRSSPLGQGLMLARYADLEPARPRLLKEK